MRLGRHTGEEVAFPRPITTDDDIVAGTERFNRDWLLVYVLQSEQGNFAIDALPTGLEARDGQCFDIHLLQS